MPWRNRPLRYWVVKSADSFKIVEATEEYVLSLQTSALVFMSKLQAFFGPEATDDIEIAGNKQHTS